MNLSKNPAFNLKAVLKETGISADTLRAWERRYGLPLPQRSAGGHRLYSEYDVGTIKWLIARQAEGLSISRAVELWHEHSASGRDPLSDVSGVSFPAPPQPFGVPNGETSLDGLRERWLAACMGFQETDAEQVLNQAFSMYSMETVCLEVLQKGISEIGTQWYENRASVQQEHFASALAIRRLDTLLSATPPPTRKHTILVGCPTEEWHTFTPLLLTLLLRRRGENVVYLGANVPGERFLETINEVRADLVVLAAQRLVTAAKLMDNARIFAAKKIPVAYGGRIFALHTRLQHKITGHYLGDSLEAAILKIKDLTNKPGKNPAAVEASQEYIHAAGAFQVHRPQIEAALSQSIGSLGIGVDVMQTTTEFMSDTIIAALRLGEVSFLDPEMNWVRSLLRTNGVTEGVLDEYLRHYSKAVHQNINGSAGPLQEWLARMTTKSAS